MDNFTEQNISLLLRKLSRHRPTGKAIIETKVGHLRAASFAELEAEVNEAARRLNQAGVRSLDVVLVYVPMQRELISLLLAIFRVGAQALFIDPGYGPDKVWHCLRLARPKFLVLDDSLRALTFIAPLLGLMGIKGILTFDSAKSGSLGTKLKIAGKVRVDSHGKGGNGAWEMARVAPDHPALITFTSGSTGKPKGIVRSHGFLNDQARLLQKTLPESGCIKNETKLFTVMTGLPMFLLAALASGQTAVIAAADKGDLLNQLSLLDIDRLLFAPSSLQTISQILKEHSISLPRVRQIIVGGGPVFPSLIAELRASMPTAEIITVYGSTEAEPICHRTLPAELPLQPVDPHPMVRGLPLGMPIDEIELCIIEGQSPAHELSFTRDQFESMKMPRLEEGEIVVSGAHVVPGYLGGLGDSETKFKVGGRIFHRTGDAGYVDDHGQVFLTGRAAYGVKNGADTIYPLSVELQALQNKDVERCAFISLGGKKILALTIKSGSSKTRVVAELESIFALSRTKVDRFVVVESLPVDERHGSKIVYSKLKRQLRFAS